MPTENERKYMLRLDCEPKIKKIATNEYRICQGYLIATRGITVRVRSVKSKKNGMEYWFTLKCNHKNRVIEIEQRLDQRDFDDLWDVSLNKLEKTRYKVGKGGWVVDFFQDYDDKTYFAMAECEMPEGQLVPDCFPPEILESVLYEVALNDQRFSSKLISDIRFARRLFNEYGEKLTSSAK